MSSIYRAPFTFYSSIRLLRALVAALGIVDEVETAGLKGSKKKSKKSDGDWVINMSRQIPFYTATEERAFTANSQAAGSQGGTKGYPSYAANPEPQGPAGGTVELQ